MKMLHGAKLFVFVVGAAMLAAGCNDQPVVPTATSMMLPTSVTGTAVAEAKTILSRLTDATVINIKDDWGGFSPVSPLLAHISIIRNANVYTGSGSFAAGPGPLASHAEDYVFADSTIEDFLIRLSASPIEARPYLPDAQWGDDYPSIIIEVQLRDEKVVFHTESQGNLHIPWAIDINGDTYTIDSSQPNYALQEFERHYPVDDVMDDLIEQITGTR